MTRAGQGEKYYQSKHKFNGVDTRNNLLKIKDGVNIISLGEWQSIWTHCIKFEW